MVNTLVINYPVSLIAKALKLSRSYLYWLLKKEVEQTLKLDRMRQKYAHLKFYFDSLAKEFPTYGYRRVRVMLKRRYQINLSKKTTQLIMRAFNLSLPVKKKRTKPNYQQLRATRPNELWQSDMTKVWVARVGWLHLFSIIDCFTREIVGYSLSLFASTKELLKALDMAVSKRFASGIPDGINLTIGSDNGCQYTSKAFREALKALNFKFMRTNYNTPEQNAFIESFFSTLKQEEVWLKEYSSIAEAEESISNWIYFYNYERIHSSLNYLTPTEFMTECESQVSLESLVQVS